MSLLQNGDILATSNHRQYLVEPKKNTYKTVNPGLIPTGSRWMAQGDEAFGGDLWVGQGLEIRCLAGWANQSLCPEREFCILTLNKREKKAMSGYHCAANSGLWNGRRP